MRAILAASAFTILSALGIGPALADAIDGAWCHDQGDRMMIRGPLIVTPGGNRVQGDYSRHAFSYVVPAGEAGNGTLVRMVLMGEEHVQVQFGQSTPVIWNRCGPPTS